MGFSAAHFSNDKIWFQTDETVEDVDGCTRNRTEEVSTFQLKESSEAALLTPPNEDGKEGEEDNWNLAI